MKVMAGTSVHVVAVCGASASADSVRRALWLPREPDVKRPLRSVLRVALRPGTLAVTGHDGYVLVHGASALPLEREWLSFSADRCRVLAVSVLETGPTVRWALYEEGARTRLVDTMAGRDEGERRPFEAPPGTDPVEAVRALYLALTDKALGDDLDLQGEVGAWFVEP
jgi:hypothetical protein